MQSLSAFRLTIKNNQLMMSNTKYDLMVIRRRRSVTCDATELIPPDTAMSSCGRTNSILLAPDDGARPISSGSTFKSKNHSPNKAKAKNSGLIPFPVKLHAMLDKSEADGLADVVSWAAHGRCFWVHKPKKFVMHIMPQHFKQSKMTSFRRQLNLYGFKRLTGGLDRGGYYHESFIRGDIDLAYKIRRMRIKGTCVQSPANPHTKPAFNVYVTKNIVISEQIPDDYCDSSLEQLKQHHHHHQEQNPTTKIDVLFFEGRPFHYIDSSELTILKNINRHQDVDSTDDSMQSLSRSIDTKDDIDFFIKSIGIPTEISIINN